MASPPNGPAGGISGPSNLPKMRIPLFLRATLLAVVMVGWMAAPALAAPTVLSTSPEEGAEMHEPPGEVTIEFSEPLQDSSGLIVRDGCGDKVSEGGGRVVGTAMNELNVVIGSAPHHGTYTVDYVATGVTGTATGSYTFVVHGGTGCDGSGSGGTGGHDGHEGGDDDGSGTGDGGHGDGHGGEGRDHDGSGGMHDGSSDGNHSGSNDHSGMSTPTHMSNHGEHQDMSHRDPKKNRHRGHRNGNNHGATNPPLAAGEDGRGPTDIPTGTTVIIALGLAILMGVVGGWVLRVSTPG